MNKNLSILLFGLCLMLIPTVTLANGLPNYPMLTKPGGLMVPAGNVSIAVDKEVLAIDLTQRPILVNAQYTLTNPLSLGTSVQVFFPISKNCEAKVLLAGEPLLASLETDTTALAAEEAKIPDYWLDPYTGERYVPQENGYRYAFDILRFTVFLGPQESKVLAVEYGQNQSYDPTRFFRSPIERFDYLLLPAKHWGAYKNLEINLKTSTKIQFASNFSFVKIAEGNYSFKSAGLPKENLSIFFIPRGSALNGGFASFYHRYILQIALVLGSLVFVSVIVVLVRRRNERNRFIN